MGDNNADAELGDAPHLACECPGQPDATMRGGPIGNDALVHSHARPGDALHVEHRGVVVDVGTVPAILFDDAEYAGRRRMARHASRHTRVRDRMAVRVERELLLVDRDDDGEHAVGLGGEVLALRLCRSLVPGGERRAFRLRWTPGLGLPHWLLIERQRLGRDSEPGEQSGTRRHDQKRFAVARMDGMDLASPLELLHEGPPWCSRSMLRGLVAPRTQKVRPTKAMKFA